MYAAARSLLFRLDAERAHELTLDAFRRFPKLATLPFAGAAVDDPVERLGLRFANRVGLAAGLDKNGECLDAWARLGFGFVEVGTVTPRPQPGNPKPRMFRLPTHGAIINRLGFNNKGVDHLLARVAESDYRGVLGINIGKNFDTPIERAADDYLIGLRKVWRAASYVTVNISSPNTKNLRELQGEDPLRELLRRLRSEADALAQQHGKRTPMLVKIAPDVDDAQLDAIARVARETGVDGLIATNTTVARPGLDREPLARETGGLSGAPLAAQAERTLAALRRRVGDDFVLVGVGGIGDAAAACARRAAGADLLQVYTGFIYRGPALVGECAAALRTADRSA
ncbi:MAG TPA: quinone-dependent dihydroorotate dehydrogenase [Solimonas sp.]|nr:quinone-dependent dihydroorotate dehydrogenase [Solimonas sp.]